jgi:sugar lactone lactonase YvrE
MLPRFSVYFLFLLFLTISQTRAQITTCPSSIFSNNSINLSLYTPIELEVTPQSGGSKRIAIAWRRKSDNKLFLPLDKRATPGQSYSPLPSTLYNVPNVASCGGDAWSGDLRPKVIFFRGVLLSPIISGTVISINRESFDLAEDCTSAAGTGTWCNANTGFGYGGACNSGYTGPAGYVSIDLRGTGFTLAQAGNVFASSENNGACGPATIEWGSGGNLLTAETAKIISYSNATLDIYNETSYAYKYSLGFVGPRIILSRRSDNLGWQIDSNSTGSFPNATICPSGTIFAAVSLTCTFCTAGSYSVSGDSICTQCPAGTFSAYNGSSSCTSCPAGQYTTNSGATSCTFCASNTYSYQAASSCSTCPTGSTFISSALGCHPSSLSSTGPIDTSFYFSGSQSEGIKAFSNIVNVSNGLTFYSNSSSYPNVALTVSNGSYISTPLLSSLPSGSSPFTVSSWVKCDATSLTVANRSNVVIAWGTSQMSTTSTGSLTSATLSVTSKERVNVVPTVSTFAGSNEGYVDGIGTNAKFQASYGVAVDSSGNVFVADRDNQRIRKITLSGEVTTLAGHTTSGSIDGIGTNAKFFSPTGVAVDKFSGNIFVADRENHRIRKVTLSGVVTTFAGSGIAGYADGAGTNAKFYNPRGIAADSFGNIYVGDESNHRIRKITSDGVVSTFAGGGSGIQGYADGTGTNAKFNCPMGVTINDGGNVYVADTDNHCIRIISSSGVVTTLAGSGTQGFADGVGTNAKFCYPYGVALDAVGNVYVPDLYNHRIRKITPSGVVTTIAGSGSESVADGTGTNALFGQPTGIASDSFGNLYVASNHRIRKITLSPSLPGPLPVCDSTWHHIALSYSGSSSTNTLTAFIDGVDVATSISVSYAISTSSTTTLRLGWNGLTPTSTSGELFSGSMSDLRIYSRSLNSSEIVTLSQPLLTTYTNAINPSPIASSTSYTWYCSSGSYGPTVLLIRSSSDGTWSSSGSVNCQPCPANTYSYQAASSCSTCPTGSTFISSALGCRPSSLSSTGPIDTSFYFSGSQSEGVSAFTTIVNTSNGIVFSSNASSFPIEFLSLSSKSYLSTPFFPSLPTGSSPFTVSSWVKCDASSYTDMNPSGVIVAWGAPGEMSTSASMTAVTLAVTNIERKSDIATVSTFAGSGSQSFEDGTGTNVQFNYPYGVAVDLSDNVYIADRDNHRIRKITPSGVVTTLAGTSDYGSTDGIGTNAKFFNPTGVAVDSLGNVYVADRNNHLIRKITSSGLVTTLAGSGSAGFVDGIGTNAKFYNPRGIAVDSTGNIYVGDESNHVIRKVTATGNVTTLAGGGVQGFADNTGTSAKFNSPMGIALDSSGNVYVADTDNHRIRKIIPSGVVTTLAGNGMIGFADGTGTSSKFFYPYGVTVDSFFNVYVADLYNYRVRKITSSAVVTTLAGDGSQSFSEGTGTNAKFHQPTGIVLDSQGSLYIADHGNHRIRKIIFSPSLLAPFPVCDSTWHHIALTYSGQTSSSTLSAYIDGKSVGSTSVTFGISTSASSSLRIGWNGFLIQNNFYSGSISDIRVFNRSISPIEVLRLTFSPPTSSATPSATASSAPSTTSSTTTSPSISSSTSSSSSSSSSPTATKTSSVTTTSTSSSTSTSFASGTASSTSSSITSTGTISSGSTVSPIQTPSLSNGSSSSSSSSSSSTPLTTISPSESPITTMTPSVSFGSSSSVTPSLSFGSSPSITPVTVTSTSSLSFGSSPSITPVTVTSTSSLSFGSSSSVTPSSSLTSGIQTASIIGTPLSQSVSSVATPLLSSSTVTNLAVVSTSSSTKGSPLSLSSVSSTLQVTVSSSSLPFSQNDAYVKLFVLVLPVSNKTTASLFFKLAEFQEQAITSPLRRDLSKLLDINTMKVVVFSIIDIPTNISQKVSLEKQVNEVQINRRLVQGNTGESKLAGISIEVAISLGKNPDTKTVNEFINKTISTFVTAVGNRSGSFLPSFSDALVTKTTTKLPLNSFELSIDLSSLGYFPPTKSSISTDTNTLLAIISGSTSAAGLVFIIGCYFFCRMWFIAKENKEALERELRLIKPSLIDNPLRSNERKMSEEKKKKIFIPLMPSVPRQHTSNQPFFETTIDRRKDAMIAVEIQSAQWEKNLSVLLSNKDNKLLEDEELCNELQIVRNKVNQLESKLKLRQEGRQQKRNIQHVEKTRKVEKVSFTPAAIGGYDNVEDDDIDFSKYWLCRKEGFDTWYENVADSSLIEWDLPDGDIVISENDVKRLRLSQQ